MYSMPITLLLSPHFGIIFNAFKSFSSYDNQSALERVMRAPD